MLFYFEFQGIATLLTHLFTGMEKDIQGVQGVTPSKEVAQLAAVGNITPQQGTDGSRDATHSAHTLGNPSRPALHLSSLSLKETPQRALQH